MKTIPDILLQNRRSNRPGRSLHWLAALLVSSGSLCAQTSTWNGGSSSSSDWSDANNWGGTAVASGNALTFGGTTRQTNTNDVSGLNSLGQITFNNSGWTISGDAVGIGAGITDSATTGANAWNLATTLGGPTLITSAGDTLTINGVLSGSGNVIKAGSGTVVLAGTNVYTGSTSVTNGTLNVTGNESGGGGSWLMPVNQATATLNFKAGSVVSVNAGNTIQVGSSPSAGTPNYQTLNSYSTVTNNGTLEIGRGGYLNIFGGTWVQSGTMSVLPPGGSGYGAQMVISNGVSFIYNGSNYIIVASSASNGGSGILDIYNGTLTTSMGFSNTIPLNTSTGYGQIVLTNNGTILLSANVPELTTGVNTNGTPTISLGTAGGTINTGPYSTTVTNIIGGSGALTKLGSGTLTLGATDTYTGKTVINAGTLALNGGSIANSASITISNGATLDVSALGTWSYGQAIFTAGGAGAINGSVSLTSVGDLAPGGAGTVGTLTITNNLTLNSSVITLKLSSNPASGNDLVNVLGSVINNGATLALDPASGSSGTLSAGTYTLMTYGSLAGAGSFTLAGTITNATLNVGANALTLVVGSGGTTIQTIQVYPITTAAVWNGASPGDSYWSDATNWNGFLVSTTATVSLTMAGTARITNTNNLTGVTLGAVILTNSAWNISGNPVTLTSGSFTADIAGTTTWGLASTLTATPSFTQSASGDTLNLTGYLSGSGGITKTEGSTGQGVLELSCTTNSFTGAVHAYSGTVVYYSLAPIGQNCSLGAGSAGAIVNVGVTGTSYGGTLTYAGTNNGITDRGLSFANLTTSSAAFNNNSPDNSSLEYDGPITLTGGTPGDVWTTVLGGTSTGTNTFEGEVNANSLAGGNVSITGPGTWVFGNLIGFTNNITVATNSHLVFAYTNTFPYSQAPGVGQITLSPGGTLDVSTYDQNGAMFMLGSYSGGLGTFPQILVAGRTNGAAIDINGSLNLTGPAGATLNVAGSGMSGTVTISSNLVTGGTIYMDLNTNTTVGSGVNDLILVGSNLDLSQAYCTIAINALKGTIVTNTPYTLISYSGSLIGDPSTLSVASPGRAYGPGVVSTAIPGLVQVTFYPSGETNAALVWQGNNGPNWDIDITPNWLNAGSSDFFYNGDNVLFNDTSAQTSVNLVGPVAPGSLTVSNNVDNYVFATSGGGSISGSTTLLKQGSGELTIDAASAYTGGTVISAGTISEGNNAALSTGAVTLGDAGTGTNTVSLLVNGGVTVSNLVTVTTNGSGAAVIGYELGGNCTMNGPITIQRALTIYSSNPTTGYSLLMQGGMSGTGDVTIAGGGSVKWQSNGSLGLTNPFAFSGNLYIASGTNGSATYLGINAALNTNTSITVGTNAVLGIVNSAPFNALIGGGLVEPGYGAAYTAPVVIGTANGSGTFSGSITVNPGGYPCSLTKNGTGTETFTGDNSGSPGGSSINAGTMVVDNATGYGLGMGGVAVASGATLAGHGIIGASGTSTFSISGVVSVGDPGHTSATTFTFTNNSGLTIGSGGALAAGLFSGAGAGDNSGNAAAADVLVAMCPVTLNTNSILTVTAAPGMTGWALGDKWKIANWKSTPSGSFGTLNLPVLPAGLAWDTSSLYSAGTIDIVSGAPTQPANITSVSFSNGSIILTGTNLNGGSSFQYEVLTSTNLTLPLSNWTVLSTNSFNANGTFSYTNAVNPASPAVFFDVEAVP